MSRVIVVYSPRLLREKRTEMALIRWHRISAALAARGHTVHMASATIHARIHGPAPEKEGEPTTVPITKVDWASYDMVKTLFHLGYETLERYGGADHPFIISKLGSVVGPHDMDGIYFYGRQRERMYRTQQRISRSSRYVTLLSEPAVELWRECFGGDQRVLLVPGAADAKIPPPGPDPYPGDVAIRVVFSGNFYHRTRASQPEAHSTLADRLNRLGEKLAGRGARLFVVGPGDDKSLDARCVTYLGVVPYDQSWNHLHHATVGIVLAPGRFLHNNESTKIYHYLRAGLPVVSESGFPNDHVVRESGFGLVVANGDTEAMADGIMEAAGSNWDRDGAIRYILDNHTWDRRVETYDRILIAATD